MDFKTLPKPLLPQRSLPSRSGHSSEEMRIQNTSSVRGRQVSPIDWAGVGGGWHSYISHLRRAAPSHMSDSDWQRVEASYAEEELRIQTRLRQL
ncbi:unnamed protein product [Nezara viridula]|uniref:Uncharacterized protein n=1 Tax=Nezara viridula TaxID=85310 RepID=A0A9P0H6N9_NEZVI|nr:unnamed protein product [Nezara viridula]